MLLTKLSMVDQGLLEKVSLRLSVRSSKMLGKTRGSYDRLHIIKCGGGSYRIHELLGLF